MSGSIPSPALLEQEAKALIALKELRSHLLAAMAEPAEPQGGEEPPTGQQR
jgi:hypothetical protein